MEDLVTFGQNQKHIHIITSSDVHEKGYNLILEDNDAWLTVWKSNDMEKEVQVVFGPDSLTKKWNRVCMAFSVYTEGGISLTDGIKVKDIHGLISMCYEDPDVTKVVMVNDELVLLYGSEGCETIKELALLPEDTPLPGTIRVICMEECPYISS